MKDFCNLLADLRELGTGIQLEASGMQFEDRAANITGVTEPHPSIALFLGSQTRMLVIVKRTGRRKLELAMVSKNRAATYSIQILWKPQLQRDRVGGWCFVVHGHNFGRFAMLGG